jgi:hypothetical protein
LEAIAINAKLFQGPKANADVLFPTIKQIREEEYNSVGIVAAEKPGLVDP